MAAAARLTDPIGHSPTMSWLLTGLLVGAAIAVTAVAIVGTGGLAAVAIVGGAAATGAGIGEMASTMSFAGKEVVGAILTPGASNVFANGLKAARAHLDSAGCDKHPAPATIATGSDSVFINGMPAARVDDKTICSAVILAGSPDVHIGGGTVQTDQINPENLVPGWVHASLLVAGVGCALVLAAPAVVAGGLVFGIVGGVGGNWLGGQIFGEGSDGQKVTALVGSVLFGFLGAKGVSSFNTPKPSPITASRPPPRNSTDIENPILSQPRVGGGTKGQGSGNKVDDVPPRQVTDPDGNPISVDPKRPNKPPYAMQERPGTPRAHGFPDIIDNYAGDATTFQLPNGGTLYQLPGSFNGKAGRFEWIIDPKMGGVTHRMFVPNGTVNGIPSKP